MVLLEWNHEDLFLQLHRLIEEQHASTQLLFFSSFDNK